MATKTVDPRQVSKNHLKAMGHPLRERVWSLLLELRVASPKEIADELNADLDSVSYHVKRLAALGCAELVGKKPVRGVVKHLYMATKRMLVEDAEWNALLAENPRLAEYQLGTFMQAVLDSYRAAVEAETLGGDDRFLIDRNPVVVDAEGCDRILEWLDRFEREALPEIVRESAERRDDPDNKAVRMDVCLLAFKTPSLR